MHPGTGLQPRDGAVGLGQRPPVPGRSVPRPLGEPAILQGQGGRQDVPLLGGRGHAGFEPPLLRGAPHPDIRIERSRPGSCCTASSSSGSSWTTSYSRTCTSTRTTSSRNASGSSSAGAASPSTRTSMWWGSGRRPTCPIPTHPRGCLSLFAIVFFAGWTLSRGANMQKYFFKTDPQRALLGFIKPKSSERRREFTPIQRILGGFPTRELSRRDPDGDRADPGPWAGPVCGWSGSIPCITWRCSSRGSAPTSGGAPQSTAPYGRSTYGACRGGSFPGSTEFPERKNLACSLCVPSSP